MVVNAAGGSRCLRETGLVRTLTAMSLELLRTQCGRLQHAVLSPCLKYRDGLVSDRKPQRWLSGGFWFWPLSVHRKARPARRGRRRWRAARRQAHPVHRECGLWRAGWRRRRPFRRLLGLRRRTSWDPGPRRRPSRCWGCACKAPETTKDLQKGAVNSLSDSR